MEYFDYAVDVLVTALNHILKTKGYDGILVFNSQKIRGKFNIWAFTFTLSWIKNPEEIVPVKTLQTNYAGTNKGQELHRKFMLIRFVEELFAEQDEIWNLISTRHQ